MRLIDNISRLDKKNTTYVYCKYKFIRPVKFYQHYKSNKNQCSFSSENNLQRKVPRPWSPTFTPIWERDWRKDKSQVTTQAFISEPDVIPNISKNQVN